MPDAARRARTCAPASRVATRVEHVVAELPIELAALPGDVLKFEGLDTERPTLRTVDGRRYVGRYETSAGETLVVGMEADERAGARVVATAERRLRFAPA